MRLSISPVGTRTFAVLSVVAGVLLAPTTVAWYAGEVRVRVVDSATGDPLAKAAVCLGTRANRSQFGAYLTDSRGAVRFEDIPYTPLVLTVSKNQYRGYEIRKSAVGSRHHYVVPLASGGLGPVCNQAVSLRTPEPAVPVPPAFRVTRFQLEQGGLEPSAGVVTLTSKVRGNPTHYRASERPDFADASWLPFEPSPRFELSAGQGVGKKTVYYQVRRYAEMDGATIETLSNVRSDSVAAGGSN